MRPLTHPQENVTIIWTLSVACANIYLCSPSMVKNSIFDIWPSMVWNSIFDILGGLALTGEQVLCFRDWIVNIVFSCFRDLAFH